MRTSRVLLVLALAAGLGGAVRTAPAQVPDKVCLLCHDDVAPADDDLPRAHRSQACVDCHVALRDSDVMEEMEHAEDLPAVDCAACHQEQQGLLDGSSHAAHFAGDQRPYPSCRDCHAVEHFPVQRAARPAAEVKREVAARCSTCHEKDLVTWHDSAHSAELLAGNAAAPSCVDCHSSHDILAPEDPASSANEAHLSTRCETCHTPFRQSLHRAPGAPLSTISCAFCHLGHTTDRESLDARIAGTGGANRCFVCHSGQHTDPRMAHHQLAVGPDGRAPETACTDCHVFHWKVGDGQGHPGRPVSACASCHEDQARAYAQSAHARSRAAGNVEPPTCTTCHGQKDVLDPAQHFTPEETVKLCSSCHANADLMITFDVNVHVVEGFEDTYHGKLYDLMNTGKRFAVCTDCHGYHNVLEPEDPDSKVNRARIVETCRECHEEANENFISYLVHPVQNTAEERERGAELAGQRPHREPRDGNGNGNGGAPPADGGVYGTLFRIATWCMKALFAGVMTFFLLHTALWLQRSLRQREGTPTTRHYRRFGPYERMLHVMVNVSFLLLAFTGLPQTFAHTGMGRWILENVMSLETAQELHYLAAAVTGLYFALHLAQILWVMRRKGWRTVLLGPDSLVPRRKDWDDFVQHVRWFLGKGPRPVFDRWTYWEKFDYFAVFWGVAIIGTSGLVRWREEFFGNLFGGGLVSIATAVHEEEALLATAFIFIVHFFNTHLRGEKFPMDLSIYTGVVTEEELREERPAQVARLEATGTLETLAVPGRPGWSVVLASAWGIAALLIGLFLLVLIVIGFTSQGF